jgi:hypothetical protein
MATKCNVGGTKRGVALVVYGLLLLCVAAVSEVLAVNVAVAWDASSDTTVAGYKIYYGAPGEPKQSMNVGSQTSCSISSLATGSTYEFSVTAYNASGVESDPSNLLTFTTPAGSGYYTLTINPFKNGYVQVSPRGSGPLGNLYLPGTQVTLMGTAKSGATFAGWTINGAEYPSNPQMLTMNGDTVVTPYFKVVSGVSQDLGNTGASMSMQRLNGQLVLSVGGEVGAWTVESSTDLLNWEIAGSGLTSAQLPVSASGNGFFRVRAFNAATDQ